MYKYGDKLELKKQDLIAEVSAFYNGSQTQFINTGGQNLYEITTGTGKLILPENVINYLFKELKKSEPKQENIEVSDNEIKKSEGTVKTIFEKMMGR